MGLVLNGIDTLEEIKHLTTETEIHLHSDGRWFGKSADQSGNDWAADTLTPFQAISGNGVYGADADDEAKIVGSADTPWIIGDTHFDLHQLLIVAVSVNTEFKLRFVYGTGTMANAIIAEQYSEEMVKFDALNPQQSAGIPFKVQAGKHTVGIKMWVQAKNATDNATIGFYWGGHPYPPC